MMRRKTILAAAVFLILLVISLWRIRPASPPCLAYVDGRIAFSKGRLLQWINPDGSFSGNLELPESAERLMSWDGTLAFVPRGSNRLLRRDSSGTWITEAPPKASSGDGVWAVGTGQLYYLQLRPAAIWTRVASETQWRTFWAEGEELENPVDLFPQGNGLVVLNRDPAEAVVFDEKGTAVRRFDLTRSKLWPLQRPVFESALDYVRLRRCETPRRLWSREDGRLAVLFTTEGGDAPRLVSLNPGSGESVTVKEAMLGLRVEGRKRKAVIQEMAFLPESQAVLTSNLGGLWLHGGNLQLMKEWEKLPLPPSSWTRWMKILAPWLMLMGFLLTLLGSAWPRNAGSRLGTSIPRRAWVLGGVSLVVPGLGQLFQKRWGWVLFWLVWTVGWGVLSVYLTLRLKRGGFVTPATYVESLVAFLVSWAGSAFQAFLWEWRKKDQGPL
jgi:hypothetical protein